MKLHDCMSEYVKIGLLDLIIDNHIEPSTEKRLNEIADEMDARFTKKEIIVYLKIFHGVTLKI